MKYQTIALIVAAGSGTRCNSIIPKQYIAIDNISSLERSIVALLPLVDGICVVINPKDIDLYHAIASKYNLLPYATGGDSRQSSVYNGLKHLVKNQPKKILIHDAVRPFIAPEVVSKIINQLDVHQAVIAASPVTDSLKKVNNNKIVHSLDRNQHYHAQTPQGFDFKTILKAHHESKSNVTDDAALCESMNIPVYIVESTAQNYKITYLEDLTKQYMSEFRSGTGFDAHAIDLSGYDDSYMVIGGIKIASKYTIRAHSDGDVALHALVDAMLGAIGAGDIGQHFPPTDQRWLNADSSEFVKFALDLIKEKHATIINADLTIICETPRIGPYRFDMQQKIASLLEVSVDRINIKATTTEQMGFTGRKEGVAAQAIITIKI